jgi:hypothetical protein
MPGDKWGCDFPAFGRARIRFESLRNKEVVNGETATIGSGYGAVQCSPLKGARIWDGAFGSITGI